MIEIPVYKAEREDGIADLVRSTASVQCAAQIELVQLENADYWFNIIKEDVKKLPDIAQASANKNQFDLHYLKTLLVSTGWNKNQDVFDHKEMWIARKTPEDKPINYEHDMSDIIGHITSNYTIDSSNNLLDDTLTIDELPEEFHIITGSVLYKYWSVEEKQKRMDKIIAEIAKKKWFVSMEALFKGFDYAVKTPDGQSKIIARTQDSAFLTKHLRAYGGTGKYENYEIGRLMRNISFSGQGLVLKPANDKSIIFANDTQPFKGVIANLSTIYKKPVYDISSSNVSKEKIMASEIELQNEIKELKSALAQATKSLQDNDTKAYAKQIESASATISEQKETISKLEKVKAELTAELQEKNEQLEEATALLEKVAVEQAKATRIANVVKALNYEETKAEEFVDDTREMSDEAFARHLKSTADYMSEKLAAYKGGAPKDGGRVGDGSGSGEGERKGPKDFEGVPVNDRGQDTSTEPNPQVGDPIIPPKNQKSFDKQPIKTVVTPDVPRTGTDKAWVKNFPAKANLDNAKPVNDGVAGNQAVATVDEEVETTRASIVEFIEDYTSGGKKNNKGRK